MQDGARRAAAGERAEGGEKQATPRQRKQRVPKYLREDFPKHSLAPKGSVLDEYQLGLRSEQLARLLLPEKCRPGRLGKTQRRPRAKTRDTGENLKLQKKKKKQKRKKKMKVAAKSGAAAEAAARKQAASTAATKPRTCLAVDVDEIMKECSPRRPLRGHEVSQPAIRRRRAELPFSIAAEEVRNVASVATGAHPLAITSPGVAPATNAPAEIPLLEARSLSKAEQRINSKLIELRAPQMASAFFERVAAIEARQASRERQKTQERRRQGRCSVVANVLAVVNASGEEYQAHLAQQRRAMQERLRVRVETARRRKTQLETERVARVADLALRHQSAAEKAAAWRQRQASAVTWMSTLQLAMRAEVIHNVVVSLGWLKLLRFKAVIIQRNVRVWLAIRFARRLNIARDRIAFFAHRFVVARRHRRRQWAAKLLVQFLEDNRQNFPHIIRNWRRRVIRCQRFVRDYHACTAARVTALSKIWFAQERRLGLAARAERRRRLEDQSSKLQSESDRMQSSNFHRQMAKNWLRGVAVPQTSDIRTRDGRLYFPVGVHLRRTQTQEQQEELRRKEEQEQEERNQQRRRQWQREQSLPAGPAGPGEAGHLQLERYGSVLDGEDEAVAKLLEERRAQNCGRGRGELAHREAMDARMNKNVQFVMDIYLNDEFQSKLQTEREKPLSLPTVSRAVRTEVLRGIVEDARRAHHRHLASLKREQRLVETQRVSVGEAEARCLLQEGNGEASMLQLANAMIPHRTQQVMPLYSRIKPEFIFRRVREAQAKIARTPSVRKIILSLTTSD